MDRKREPLFSELMADVPRGDSTRYLRQQTPPQARWMPLADIQDNKDFSYDPLNPGKKVLIGRLGDRLIGIEDDRHILTVAGSRSGKSVGLVSNLLFYAGSVLAMDPKGELAEITAERRARLGQKVYVLDPFGYASPAMAKFRASYNPMKGLSLCSPTLLEDAALIAEAIVVQPSQQSDQHWDESAKNFIEAVIVHVATDARYLGRRNLVTVRELISVAMKKPPGKDQEPYLYTEMRGNGERLAAVADTAHIGGPLGAAAFDFFSKSEGELSGVLSTVNRHTRFLDYAALRSVMQQHDFDLADLKREPGGVSIYLCFPATRADLSRRWMRIFVNQLLDAMEREKTKPPAPVLACLDEFPVLGYMKQLETAAGLIASFDVKLWTILQDWSQGKALYGERWETFAGNAGILQFFGNSDLTTTEYISRRLGKTQVETTRNAEVAQEQSAKGLSGRSQSIELHDLLMPDEVSRYFARSDPKQRQLLLWAGKHPMMVQRVIWYGPDGVLNKYAKAR